MNKIKTETHDGYQIITAIAQLIPDPAATHAHCEPLVHAEPKAAEVRQKKQLMQDKNRRAGQIAQKARVLMTNRETMQVKTDLTPDEKLQKSRLDADWNTVFVEIGETQKELQGLSVELDAARKDHRRCNPVYNEPGAGWFIDRGVAVVGPDEVGAAKIMTEAELDDAGYYLPDGRTVDEMVALWMGKGEREAVTVGGETVPDYRGVTLYSVVGDKWLGVEIKTLGTGPDDNGPGAEIPEYDLTDEQRAEIDAQNETERVAGLDAEARTSEYADRNNGLLNQAITMRSGLEIQGSTAAAAKTAAAAWYDGELVALKELYSITG